MRKGGIKMENKKIKPEFNKSDNEAKISRLKAYSDKMKEAKDKKEKK